MNPRILLAFRTHNEEFAAILKGIVRYAQLHHAWSFHLDNEARAESDAAWLCGQKFDGVINTGAGPALIKTCAQFNIPLVDLGAAPPQPGIPKIRPDNAAIGRLGAHHLMEQGFQNLSFCGIAGAASAIERREGFTGAARLAKIPCDVLEVDCMDISAPAWKTRATAAIAQWLRRKSMPAAVMACDDRLALMVLAAAHEAGLRVPEEVAVLGANNDLLCCDLSHPSLSSVAVNAFQSGYLAAECLGLLIAGSKPESADIRVAPSEVVKRQSTSTQPIGDKVVASALNCIRARACHGLTVAQVLKQTLASRSVLEKKFRAHLGRSPQAEIRRVQVEKICLLLRETDFPLKKIAGLTGFEHVEYLCVVFKRFTGQAPGAFRKKARLKTKH